MWGMSDERMLTKRRLRCRLAPQRDESRCWKVIREIPDEVKRGHVLSICLDDGMVLATFGYHDSAGALVLWKP